MLTRLVRQLFSRSRSVAAARTGAELLRRGVEEQASGRLANAEAVFREVLAGRPGDSNAQHLLGHVLRLQGRLAEAIDVLRALTESDPQAAEAWYSLGDARRAQGGYTDAVAAFRKAIALKPSLIAAWVSCADALAVLERLDEAEDCYRAALERQPGFAEAHYNYGNLLHREGRIEEAIASYRRAVELDPGFMRAHSNLVYALNFSPAHPPEEIYAEHLEWARRHAAPLAALRRPHRNLLDPARRLRVGYVSPNFRDHAVTYFFEPTLRHHDRARFSIYLYSDVREPDARTARLRSYGDTWRDIGPLPDEGAAELVREDAIDILVDLTGHTDNHRLLLFARKPAPVQVTWNGYANTTGMDAVDYRVTDAYADPPGMTDHLHTEKLMRLPGIFMAFDPPESSPPVGPLPLFANGHVTFGAFNALAKVTPRAVAAWSQILHAVPQSQLLMLTIPEGRTRECLLRAFAGHGIPGERLQLVGRLPFDRFLGTLQRADIALDPFHFSGTTTTCHTLWMGVPVMTLAGRSHASRVGVSMLLNLGLAEWVAGSIEEYVTLAAGHALDQEGLSALRERLRARMQDAPNTDGALLTRHLEDAYRKMWEDYCRAAAP